MSDRSPNIMRLARAEALAQRHEYIGTEHLLVALAGVPDSPAYRAIAARGVYQGTLRTQVHRLTALGAFEVSDGELPHTPWAKQALERAVEEAGSSVTVRSGLRT